MKLIDLLARELGSWPCSNNEFITQSEYSMELFHGEGDGNNDSFHPNIYLSERHKNGFPYPHVTYDEWQSARDKLKGETKVPKANKDGWVRHRGGNQPSHDDERVEYRMRSGRICKAPAGDLDWDHNDHATDIMAWKPSEDDKCAPVVSHEFTTDLSKGEAEMPAAKPIDGPLQWRDRILELDREQVTADFDHKAATDARDVEKAELVSKLKAEGLALIGEPIKAGDSDQVDMGDWRNWMVGDKVEIEESSNEGWIQFKGIIGKLENDGDWWISFPGDGVWYVSDNTSIKWHSRP